MPCIGARAGNAWGCDRGAVCVRFAVRFVLSLAFLVCVHLLPTHVHVCPAVGASVVYASASGGLPAPCGASSAAPCAHVRDALDTALAVLAPFDIDGVTIVLAPGRYDAVCNLTLIGVSNVTLVPQSADGSGAVILSCNASVPMLRLFNSSVTLIGLTLADGHATSGAVVLANGSSTVSVHNCSLTNNSASAFGGALALFDHSILLLSDSLLGNNSVTLPAPPPGPRCALWSCLQGGGALYADSSSTVVALRTRFWANAVYSMQGTPGGGGALLVAGSLTLRQCTLQQSVVLVQGALLGYGGAVLALGPQVALVQQCEFTDCVVQVNDLGAQSRGGAVYANATQVEDSVFRGCAALNTAQDGAVGEGLGGALFVDRGGAVLVRSRFEQCLATGGSITNGGAVSSHSALSATDCVFEQNSLQMVLNAEGTGGALYVLQGGLLLRGCNFTGNRVVQNNIITTGIGAGGAVMLVYGAGLVQDCSFTNNSVHTRGQSAGGALHAFQSSPVLQRCRFVANQAVVVVPGLSAAVSGGAVAATGPSIQLWDCVLVGNRAVLVDGLGQVQGGAVHVMNGVTILRSLLLNNTAVANIGVLANGGAVCSDANLALVDSTLEGNVASCGLQRSAGGAVYLHTGALLMLRVLCRGNRVEMPLFGTGQVVGGCLAITNSTAVETLLLNVTLSENQAMVHSGIAQGGALGTFAPQVTLTGCTLSANQVISLSVGSAVFGGAVAAEATLIMENCTLNNNSAVLQSSGPVAGGAIATSVLFARGCSFRANRALYGGATAAGDVLAWVSAELIACSLDGAQAITQWPGGQAAGGSVVGSVVRLRDGTAIRNAVASATGGVAVGGAIAFLQMLDGRDALLVNCTARSQSPAPSDLGAAALGGATAWMPLAAASVSSVFYGEAAQLYAEELLPGLVQLNNVTLQSNAAGPSGDSGSGGSGAAGAVGVGGGNGDGTSSSIGLGGAIAAPAASLQNCRLLGNRASSGGAVYVLGADLAAAQVAQLLNVGNPSGPLPPIPLSTVTDTVLSGNQAQTDGGAVWARAPTHLTLAGSTALQGNTAGLLGGALALEACTTLLVQAGVQCVDNAAVAGGCVFFFYLNSSCALPSLSATANLSANAAWYGPAAASQPVLLQASVRAAAGCGNWTGLALPLLSNSSSSVGSSGGSNSSTGSSGAVVHLPRGCALVVTAQVSDVLGQAVNLPPAFLNTLSFRYSEEALCATDATTTPLQGRTTLQFALASSTGSASNGSLTPATTATAFVSQTRLGSALYSFTQPALQPVLDSCLPGDTLVALNQLCYSCSSCAEGQFNLNGDEVCRACPTEGVEPLGRCQGDLVFAAPGWWLAYDPAQGTVSAAECGPDLCATSGNASLCPLQLPQVADCVARAGPNRIAQPVRCVPYSAEAAAAGLVSGYCEVINSCAVNRAGFLCGQCVNGNYSVWNDRCVDCTHPQPGIAVGLFFAQWAQTLVLYVLLSGAASSLSKTLVYFVQVALFMVQPTGSVGVALAVLGLRLDPGTAVCPFPRTVFGAFIQEALVVPLLSAVQIVVVFALYAGVRWSRGDPIDRRRWLIRPLTAFAVSAYTPIVTASMRMLACRSAAGFYVLSVAPVYLCLGAAHRPFFAVAVLLLALVAVGLPLGILLFLRRRRQWRQTPDTLQSFGYWYEAYGEHAYWWEVVMLLRRAVSTLVGVLLTGVARSLSLAVVCALAVASQHFFSPHQTPLENAAEFAALLVLLFCANLLTGITAVFGITEDAVALTLDALVFVTVAALLLACVYNVWGRLRSVLQWLWLALAARCCPSQVARFGAFRATEVTVPQPAPGDDALRALRVKLIPRLDEDSEL